MIDIGQLKSFFPVKNFEDIVKIFEFNLHQPDEEPNLALLSILVGLIEHSLVTITDKDDLARNSRPMLDRKDTIKQKFASTQPSRPPNPSSTSSHLEVKDSSLHKQNKRQKHNDNEAGYISSDGSHDATSPDEGNGQSGGNAGANNDNNNDDDDFADYDEDCEFTCDQNILIPEIEFEVVETLYKKFVEQIKNSVDFTDSEQLGTNLKIKKISDCIWEHLSNSYYKDKAHLQSIFSYLTTSKLDCFGLAFAVIAGCQVVGLDEIYLALSEDHAWVMFDSNHEEANSRRLKELKEYEETNMPVPSCALHSTCEVTWHGKANSDKRGQPVSYKNCWLYTNGYAVKCDNKRCVAALILSLNPTINTNTDSEALALLQQRLLWLLFKEKNYFPMTLGKLGELENLSLTPNAPLTPYELFHLGIEISRNEYNDFHVYPYTYLASFFVKHGRFKEALETWADSSAVIAKYNYSRDDEEIYKEFMEVANDLIPAMLKVLTAGGLEPGRVSQRPFLQDPECLALILKFYDNICCWEEGSSTPVLHIGWAKNFVATVLKFSFVIRSKIKLKTVEEWSLSENNSSNSNNNNDCEVVSSRTEPRCSQSPSPSDQQHRRSFETQSRNLNNNQASIGEDSEETSSGSGIKREGGKNNGASSSLASSSAPNESGSLAASSGKPIKRSHSTDDKVDTSDHKHIKTGHQSTASASSATASHGSVAPSTRTAAARPREKRLELDNDNNVTVILKSRKIAGVRDLLQSERLNKTAIELQLTAQSQCAVRGRSNSSSYSSDFISSALTTGSSTRSKRLQR